MSMKIGLEYEGLITDAAGHTQRWSNIPKDKRFRIKCKMDMMDSELDPIDRYDCLAEVRTEPLENPTPSDLLGALLDQVALANRAYESEGFRIVWAETIISPTLHTECANAVDKMTKKDTSCITAHGIDHEYKNPGNQFRGGGMHINVSHIHPAVAPAFVLAMHDRLAGHMRDFEFKSNYRNNILFRTRKDEERGVWVAEYMSMGFNLMVDPKNEAVRKVEHVWDKPFGWFSNIIDVATEFTCFRDERGYKNPPTVDEAEELRQREQQRLQAL